MEVLMKYLLYICNFIFTLGIPLFSYVIAIGGVGFGQFLWVAILGCIATTTLLYLGVE